MPLFPSLRRQRALPLLLLLVALPAASKRPKKSAPAAPPPEDVPVATPDAPAVPRETTDLPCGYVPGEAHRYKVVKRSERQIPGQAQGVQGNRSELVLTVVSHEDRKTVLDVRYDSHEPLASPSDPATEALIEKIAEVTRTVPVQVEVDHDDRSPRVVNGEELVQAYQSLSGEVKALIRERVPDAPDEVFAMVDQALADRSLAEQSVLDDIRPLFGFTCGAVPVGEVRYQTALPNPFGSQPLPAQGTVTGTVSDGLVTVGIRERLDPVRVMDTLGPLLEQMGVVLPDRKLDDLQIEMGTDVEVVVDHQSGWPTRWSSQRTGTLLGGGRTDTVVVERVAAD